MDLLLKFVVRRYGLKILFRGTAERTGPILGKILKIGSGLNTVFFVALSRLVNVSAQLTHKFSH